MQATQNMMAVARGSHPQIIITEQPQQRGMRFRYECEGRSAGSIPGETSSVERKTWPTIQIVNCNEEVSVRVSLVSKDTPARSHPHSLVGRDCSNGICRVKVNSESQMMSCFSNLGIQCVKRREVSDSLLERRRLGIDPYNTFQDGDTQAVDIDLNIVRLCFEAFIIRSGKHLSLTPALSKPIFDKKATCSALLRICRVDRSYGSCKGGDEVYLLCDKVQKDDISICFFENDTGWEAFGQFSPTDVHRQVAIVFRTPPYKSNQIRQATKVFFQLKRTSDGETSDSKDFIYLPLHHDQPRKRMLPVSVDIRSSHNDVRQRIFDRVHRPLAPSILPKHPKMAYQTSNEHQMPSPVTAQTAGAGGDHDVLDDFLKQFEKKFTSPTLAPLSSGTSSVTFNPNPRVPLFSPQYQQWQPQQPPPRYQPSMMSLPAQGMDNLSGAAPVQSRNPLGAATSAHGMNPSVLGDTPVQGRDTSMLAITPDQGMHIHLSGTLPDQQRMNSPLSWYSQGNDQVSSLTATLGITNEDLAEIREISLNNIAEDLESGMTQMSIEEKISISDLIKPEPVTPNPVSTPFPNATQPSHQFSAPNPVLIIQPATPNIFQLPTDPSVSSYRQDDRNNLFAEFETSIPSFDLTDQFASYDPLQNQIDEAQLTNQ